MPNSPAAFSAQARDWVMRLQDPGFGEWDAFTAWLDSDAAHLSAYEAALAADEDIAAVLRTDVAAEPERPLRSRRGWFAGGAVAAAAVGAAALWTFSAPAPKAQEIATGAGERRMVALADGSRMELNGGTRVSIDPAEPRRATLIAGEALFEVRHDARHPFVVQAGGVRLQDAGTVFNVVQDAGRTSVAVAQGAVVYQPGPRQVLLKPGQALDVQQGAAPRVTRVQAGDVGGWRAGQLVYWNEDLPRIARDLTRNLGVPVSAGRGAERVRFTGILVVDGPPDIVLERIAPLMGVRVARSGDGWVIGPASRSAAR